MLAGLLVGLFGTDAWVCLDVARTQCSRRRTVHAVGRRSAYGRQEVARSATGIGVGKGTGRASNLQGTWRAQLSASLDVDTTTACLVAQHTVQVRLQIVLRPDPTRSDRIRSFLRPTCIWTFRSGCNSLELGV